MGLALEEGEGQAVDVGSSLYKLVCRHWMCLLFEQARLWGYEMSAGGKSSPIGGSK